MPIYEYECAACGHTFDAIQSFKEEALLDCPVCKEQALKKLVSVSAFHLKGSGWYVTDFKNPAPPKIDNTEKNNDNKGAVANKEMASDKETPKDVKVKEDSKASKPVAKTDKVDTSGEKSS
jgi:putative FmdB family regulatory protein